MKNSTKYTFIFLLIAATIFAFFYHNSQNTRPVQGSKIIIIGATSGIGASLVRECVNRGFIVGATGRRIELLNALKSELKEKIYIEQMDVAQSEQAQKQLRKLIHDMGGMDILVVNAGVLNGSLEWQKQKAIIDVNVLGFVGIISAATDYFIQKKSGHIVGVTSLLALRGSAVSPAYSASKAFESNYLDGLRARFKKLQIPIYVTNIQPGLINTAMTQDGTVANPEFTTKWGASPEQAAREICDAITARKEHAYITWPWRFVAWLFKLWPDWVFYRVF